MKTLRGLIAVCMVGCAAVCFAQIIKGSDSSQPAARVTLDRDAAIDLARTALQFKRLSIVSLNLDLTPEEAKKFWPLYNEYQDKVDALRDRFVEVLKKYSDTYDTLTDNDAKQMLKELLDVQEEEASLRRRFLPKFEAALPVKKVARFYQIDNKINTEVRYAVSLEIPLIQTQ